MKTRELFAVAALTLLTGAPAYADIFKCVGVDGHVMYSNMADKNCKKLSLEPVPSSTSASKSSARTPSPSSFPKVDENSQKARDNDRRRILETELAAEQNNLEQARKDLADQEAIRSGGERNYQRVLDRLQPYKDKVSLHERNIEAIQKEISNLR